MILAVYIRITFSSSLPLSTTFSIQHYKSMGDPTSNVFISTRPSNLNLSRMI